MLQVFTVRIVRFGVADEGGEFPSTSFAEDRCDLHERRLAFHVGGDITVETKINEFLAAVTKLVEAAGRTARDACPPGGMTGRIFGDQLESHVGK
jgi:hypothetical protein